ncbi:MAG: protein kinase [Faecousia sp.]
MSELKLVSPLLDGFIMGNPMSDHDGVRCCPAMKENTDEKYIVKIISVPASQVQLDALLLTGAYRDPAEAMDYFKEVADSIVAEVETLNSLAKLEGFIPYEGCQVVPMEDGNLGYEIYLLSTYKRSLRRYMQKNPITYLEAVNLGLDLCASLAICRRAGYLYVGLKPSNVFLSKEKQYRIGDLGFVKLDSLSYTSLPGKYRSPYSPAEVQDDMKVLNETVDTYAVGMILYQIYNDGTLPRPTLEPTDPFPHPVNADYEISSIIMKALDPDPAKRWDDPMKMGQALVGYMQRNAVNNVPITPPSGVVNTDPVAAQEPDAAPAEDDTPAKDTAQAEDTTNAAMLVQEVPAETAVPADPSAAASEAQAPAVDNTAESAEEPLPEAISEEEEDDLDFRIAFSDNPEEALPEMEKPAPRTPAPVRKPRRRRGSSKRILSAIITLVILSCLGCGAFWFYQTIYLQTIHNLTLTGTQHELTVTVDTDMNTELLRVLCTDTYGNSVSQPLVNGQAVFTDLLPDSLYRIELDVEGFHELTGKTADIFTTDAMPTIISMSAVTGSEDGSMMLNFTVDGSDPDEWMLTCSASGEEDIVKTFTGHSVTVKGLTVDKVYTLTLGTSKGDQILGNCSMDFVATRLILAENLAITDCTDGTMTVRWDAPADTDVRTWNVRCYNDEGHEEVLEIAGTEIAFTGIDSSKSYTVEVTAAGMTQPSRVNISANPLTVTGLTVDSSDLSQLTVNWTYEGTAPEGGWLLMYTLDGNSEQANVVKCETATAVVTPRIPSAAYHFVLQAADSTSVFNGQHSFVCPSADVFTFQGLSANKIRAHLLVTPEAEDWTVGSVGKDAFADTFQVGDSISVALIASDNFNLPEAPIEVTYVIRDGGGNVLSKYISDETRDWKDIWYDDDYHNGELTIPEVPQEPGDYSVSIYFNHLAVTVINFSIVA